MTKRKLPTRFAPAERLSPGEIERQARLWADHKRVGLLPDAMPCAVLVVNEHRQIVFANARVMDLALPVEREAGVLGRRPGEVLGCVYPARSEGGCGTTEFCRACGAVRAMLASGQGQATVEDCRIVRENGETLELRVWTTPVQIEGERFSIFAVLDISHEKRREALEHIFLHDIYNVAYGLSWYADFLAKAPPERMAEYGDTIQRLTRELIDEIDAQRLLLKAETGELLLRPERVSSLRLLQDTTALYSRHPAAHERRLVIDEHAEDTVMLTDRTLLSRVLCNMVKNALEASRAGETVTAGCTAREGMIELWVHNPGVMPHDVQLQVFQRSFSTKGRGRGLGTYSIRLLTERYLKGAVSFTSTAEEGTIFRIRHARSPQD